MLELMLERGPAEVLELMSERRPAQALAAMLGLRPHLAVPTLVSGIRTGVTSQGSARYAWTERDQGEQGCKRSHENSHKTLLFRLH